MHKISRFITRGDTPYSYRKITMKNKLLIILVGLVAVSGVSSCGGENNSDESIDSNKMTNKKAVLEQKKGNAMPWTNNKKLAIEKLMRGGTSYSMLSETLKKDIEVVEVALANKMPFWMLDKSFVKDKKITLLALKFDPERFKSIDESLKSDPDILLASLKSRYDSSLKNLDKAPDELKKNSDFMVNVLRTRSGKQAVQTNHLDYLATGDESPVLFPFVVDALKKDKDFVYRAVSVVGSFICDLDNSFKSERDLALSAVNQHGRALICLDKVLQKDREIALAAVKQDGTSLLILRSLRSDFVNDKEIVLAAINQAGAGGFQGIGEKLQNDKDVLKLLEEKMAR